jgi:hypothetical protein
LQGRNFKTGLIDVVFPLQRQRPEAIERGLESGGDEAGAIEKIETIPTAEGERGGVASEHTSVGIAADRSSKRFKHHSDHCQSAVEQEPTTTSTAFPPSQLPQDRTGKRTVPFAGSK